MPGVAFGEAAGSEPDSFYYTVLGNRVLCIAGTGGIKATMMTYKRAQQYLVAGYQEYKEATHQGSVPWLVLDVWRISLCHCCRNIVDSSALSN